MQNIIRIGFLILLSFSHILTNCQVIDSAFVTAKYSFVFRPDSSKENNTREDILIIDIGNKFTKCFSYNWRIRDSIMMNQIEAQTRMPSNSYVADMRNVPSGGSSKIFYKNMSTNTMTVTDNVVFDDYLYTDSLKDLTWNISIDTSTISGYLCTQAHTYFRGRKFSAWFANNIPLSAGPHIFSGLPGLIVQLEDTKGNFRFKLLSFEKQINKKPILFESKKFIQVTRQQYRKIVNAMLDNPTQFAASHGVIFREKDGSTPTAPKIPHNPIELN
jgi:GLPGLI family protein